MRGREEGGVAEGEPEEPARGVTEARHGVPRRRSALRDADRQPSVPREVLQLDRAREDRGPEARLGVVRDVLDAARVVHVEGLGPERVAGHGALASRAEQRYQLALERQPLRLGHARVGDEALVERVDPPSRPRVLDAVTEDEVGLVPSRLDPGGTHASVRTHRVLHPQRRDLGQLDGDIPVGPRGPQGRRDQARGPVAGGAHAQGSAGPGRTRSSARGGGEIGVLEVVGMVGRDGVGVRAVPRTGHEGFRHRPGGEAAGAGVPGKARRRIHRDEHECGERFGRRDCGGDRAVREGIGAEIGVKRPDGELRGRRGRGEHAEGDLLRVVGSVEGELVPGAAGARGAERRGQRRGDDRDTARTGLHGGVSWLLARGQVGTAPGRKVGPGRRLPGPGVPATHWPAARSPRSTCRSSSAHPSGSRAAP